MQARVCWIFLFGPSVQRLSQVHGKSWQTSNDDSGSKVLSGVIPLTISTPFRSRDAMLLPCSYWSCSNNPPFFQAFRMMLFWTRYQGWNIPKNSCEVQPWTLLNLDTKNCIRLWTAWKDEFHQNGQQLTISNRNHFDFCRRNKSQAVFTYICLFNPWIFCHLPNESWVWKRKLYLWLQKKTLTCFWVSRVVKKKRGVTVSTFFQILRCFHHLRTSTKQGMEKNTASWDPCRSQLSLLPWQRVMRPYGSLIAVGGFPERCRGLRLKHRWF